MLTLLMRVLKRDQAGEKGIKKKVQCLKKLAKLSRG